MRDLRRDRKKQSKVKNFILNNIYSNLRYYIIVMIILIIGIACGVIFINNINEEQKAEISKYINDFISSLKNNCEINKAELLKNSLIENFKLVLGMWFIGSTVIGLPIVFGIVLYRGFCIGYTISSTIAILGNQKGIIFGLSSILFQNIIIIPTLLVLSVSGIKLYKSIMKDKRRENIKLEIIRHTFVSIIGLLLLFFASLIETYISTGILNFTLKFI